VFWNKKRGSRSSEVVLYGREGEEITSGFLDFIIRGNCITRSVFDFNVKNRHNLQIL
jgi:hypothetical protein